MTAVATRGDCSTRSGSAARRALARWLPPSEDARWHYLSYFLPLLELRVPVSVLRGPAGQSGRLATMLVAGAESETGYLPERFFNAIPQRELLARAPVWQLPKLLARLEPAADLVVARVDRHFAARFAPADYLAVPDWVSSRLALPVDVALLARGSRSVAEDLRRMRRYPTVVEVSHDEADFAHFYHGVYVPYIRSRFGSAAYVRSILALRRAFARGGILWLRRNGARVAGDLFERHGDTLNLLALGIASGDLGLRREGLLSRLYVALMTHGAREGCRHLNLGGSRPSLRDGVLRYKAKWGAILDVPREPLYWWLVRWKRLDGAVAEFLSRTPLIFRDGNALSGLAFCANGAPEAGAAPEDLRRLWIGGLRRLCVVTHTVTRPPACLPAVRVIDHDAVREGGPRALYRALAATEEP